MAYTPVTSVAIANQNASPFGDLITAPIDPILQIDFIYGINTQTGVTTTANSATVDTNSGRLRLQSGTNVAGSAIYNSRRPAKYRPGQGVVARFTALFTTGVASSTQIVGMGSATDGYFFGFNGIAFGILHRIGGVDTWTAQTAWNGDKCDGAGVSAFNWDKTKGNVLQVKYPYLGFGNITFWIQDSATTTWILCHTIRYTNSTTTPQASNPSVFFYAQAINSGNNTNLTVMCGSVGVVLAGSRTFIGSPKWAADNAKNTITTETCLLNIRNCTTLNGVTNRSLIRINCVSFISASAAKTAANCVLRFKIGATIGGAPSYTPVNGSTADNGVTITSGNSIASVDTAGTTVAGGNYVFNISCPDSGQQIIDTTALNLFIAPAEIMTVSGFASSSATLGTSINWFEDT